MKKILVLIMLLFVSISLYAQKPLIKFIDINGNETKYNIEDISEMNFVKTNVFYKMVVYKHDTTNIFLIANVKSIEFADSNKLKINLPANSKILYIADIDSIVLIEDDCTEVTIGTQTWMCKNLDVDRYQNGDLIPEVKDSAEWANLKTGAWCYYNNNPALGAIYGKLYNWYANNDTRGLAPEGWQIPSQTTWDTLVGYLGGKAVAGGKLKSTGSLQNGDGLWIPQNLGATNESGFSALPGGFRNSKGSFLDYKLEAGFWSTKTDYSLNGLNLLLATYDGNIQYALSNVNYGFSVRCIKGEESKTPVIKAVTPDSAFVGDIITIKGENLYSIKGGSYVLFNDLTVLQSDFINWDETEIKLKVPKGATTGKISVSIREIKSNEVDFTVKKIFDFGTVTDYDGNVYKTLKIGGRFWTTSNLKVKHYRNGDPIPEVKDGTEWSNLKSGAWCDYNNEPVMESTYGALYNWYTVNDPRGLAPEGWHVATNAEWNAFVDSLGGRDLAGSKLKDVRNEFWVSPNRDATNESGFSAKPAGQRGYKGVFEYLGYFTYWWSYQESDSNMAGLKRLYYDRGWVGNYDYYKYYGYSVRCIKDEGISMLPKIKSISPDPVSMGDILTIKGENFGFSQGLNFVSIYSKKLPKDYYQSWSDNEIKVKMPKGLSESLASATVNGFKSNDVQFNVVNISNPPKILSITPDSAAIRDVITIVGKNFGDEQIMNYISFKDLKPDKSDYQSWSDTVINVQIPQGVTTGNVSANVFGTKSNDYNYTIIGSVEYGTMTDLEGKLNQTVKIGYQWWTVKNLDVSHYRNGDIIPQITDKTEWNKTTTGAWCYYNNDSKNGEIYGKLYNWYAVNDPRGLTPVGWHIPSNNEWSALIEYIGGSWKGGGKLKTTGTYEDQTGLWNSPNSEASNKYGFSALPGGVRQLGSDFIFLRDIACFWTSTIDIYAQGKNWTLWHDDAQSTGYSYTLNNGYSIRCIKDREMDPPIINSISSDSVTYGDLITISGKNLDSSPKFSFVTFNSQKPQIIDYVSWSESEIKVKVPFGSNSGEISVTVRGLKSNSSGIEVYYNIEYDSLTDFDGKKYKTVKIGNQWWMAENLKVSHFRNGDQIPEVKDNTDWVNLKTGAWCDYNNLIKFENICGKLYNWYSVDDPRGLAPKGWHIPNDEEWKTLTDFLSGEKLAGGILKEVGEVHWAAPNTGPTNAAGFTALPGGQRLDNGNFENINFGANFWSSSPENSSKAWSRNLGYLNKEIFRYSKNKAYGLSIRCVKD